MRQIFVAIGLTISLTAVLCAEETLDRGRIPQLIEQLDDPDPAVRGEAAADLAEFHTEAKAAVPKLVGLLSDEAEYRHEQYGVTFHSSVNFSAARALSSIGSESVAALTLALQDDNPVVRDRAIHALHDIGTKARPAIRTLISISKESDPVLRVEIVDALSAIDPGGDETIPTLLQWLADGNTEVRRPVIESLGSCRNHPRRVVHTLLRCLDDDQPVVRGHAAQSLGRLSLAADMVVPSLMNRMTDRAEYQECCRGCLFCMGRPVANDVIVALGRFGKESRIAGPQLVELLGENTGIPHPLLVGSSIGQLGVTAHPLIPRLIEIFKKPDINRQRQLALLRTFRELGPVAREAIPAVKQFHSKPIADDESGPDILLEAACALVSMDQNQAESAQAWERILAELNRRLDDFSNDGLHLGSYDDDPVFPVLRSLGKNARAAAPILTKLLEKSWNHKQEIAVVLATVDPQASGTTDMLVRALGEYGDHESSVEMALLEFGEPAIQSLVNGLSESANDQYHCIKILKALGEFGPQANSAMSPVIEIAMHEHFEVRLQAAQTIGKIGKLSPRASVIALDWLLDDKRPAVREQAALSLAAFESAANAVVPKLKALLKDEYIDVRVATESTLKIVIGSDQPREPR